MVDDHLGSKEPCVCLLVLRKYNGVVMWESVNKFLCGGFLLYFENSHDPCVQKLRIATYLVQPCSLRAALAYIL